MTLTKKFKHDLQTLKLCFHGSGLVDLNRTLLLRLQSTASCSVHVTEGTSSSVYQKRGESGDQPKYAKSYQI